MKNAHILAEFYFTPWAIRPDYHANFGQILQAQQQGQPVPEQVFARRRGLAPLAARGTRERPIVGPTFSDGSPMVPQMEVEHGVAVLPVWGVLGRRLSWLDLLCGGVDYEHLAAFLEMALADDDVHTLVADYDTPGGSCRGLPEVSAIFEEFRQQKRLIAYTEGLCCSAGYWLASMSHEIFASPSASIGNIGTILAAVDNSREWEMRGWRLELFASGVLKGAGFEGKQWGEAERIFFRSWMEKKFSEFQAVVKRYRPQVTEEGFDGRWVDGDIAEAYGFADGVVAGLHKVVGAAIVAAGR